MLSYNRYVNLGKSILDLGVKILLIKAGHLGAYLLTGNVSSINDTKGFNLLLENWSYRELWCKAYPADESKIINSIGAGDNAVAAFLSAILDGQTAESALKFAAITGRNNLYCQNSYEELPGWQEMANEIELSDNSDILLDFQLIDIK